MEEGGCWWTASGWGVVRRRPPRRGDRLFRWRRRAEQIVLETKTKQFQKTSRWSVAAAAVFSRLSIFEQVTPHSWACVGVCVPKCLLVCACPGVPERALARVCLSVYLPGSTSVRAYLRVRVPECAFVWVSLSVHLHGRHWAYTFLGAPEFTWTYLSVPGHNSVHCCGSGVCYWVCCWVCYGPCYWVCFRMRCWVCYWLHYR